MTRRLPIFALPGVVLMPETLLPLHIFEPRYRAMVADALNGDRTIGMALMKPGWEDGGKDPDIFAVGGAGEIVESEKLSDGRYNIVLQGRFRYRILREAGVDPYRQANVEPIASIPFPDAAAEARAAATLGRLFEAVREELSLPPLPDDAPGAERLSSELALRLRYEPAELQELLETDALPARCEALAARLRDWSGRMRLLAPYRPKEMDPGRN
ncbi:MAG TPA: LON peptidase substrate-binding domain-containing protein [Thermoanaerobaculia bacterium]